MDVKGFASQQETALRGNSIFCTQTTESPILGALDDDPLCKLNLKETSDFVKSFAMSSSGNENRGFLEISTQRKENLSSNTDTIKRSVEAPPTPGRPVFSFSVGNFSKKALPSKWENAEKWLVSGGNDSPAHHHHHHHQRGSAKLVEYCCKKTTKQHNVFRPHQAEILTDTFRFTDEKISAKIVEGFQGILPVEHQYSNGGFSEGCASADFLLKDKFTNVTKDAFPNFKCSEPMKEGFLFGNSVPQNPIKEEKDDAAKEVVNEVKHRDIGTEMTPLGSSTTSRCHTPFKDSSPARHNTPIDRSGPLAVPDSDSTRTMVVDIAHLQECHLAKLQLGTTNFDPVNSNWSSRAEEEEEISKSLRHFEMNSECRRSGSDSRACVWEEEEKSKCCLRYQREEARIEAWVNLQNAKAEAESRKLEVKIQKMRSNFEDKVMKRMGIVHRKAEEWRASARLQHFEQLQKSSDHARKVMKKQTAYCNGRQLDAACGCFPCNNHHF